MQMVDTSAPNTHLPDRLSRSPDSLLAYVLVVLVSIQIIGWGLAWFLTDQSWKALALGGLAYVLGLRHGLDADHISVIDNVSRHMIGRGEAATAIGLLFALGHSVVVSLIALLIGVTAVRMDGAIGHWREWTAVYSTLMSVGVLFLIAPRNAWAAWQLFRGLGGREDVGAITPRSGGLSAKLIRTMLQVHVRNWHMLVIGALFGLGFETATAISMMALTASHASGGVNLLVTMIYPLLFTAGMTLVDGLDGVFMERAYCWAAINPRRHARYNLGVTALAAVVAVLVGSFELTSVLNRVTSGEGRYSQFSSYVEGHFETIGIGVIVLFAVGWIGSIVTVRFSAPRPSNEKKP